MTSVADLADDAQICNCNGVCKGEIVHAVRAGATSLKAVGVAQRALLQRARLNGCRPARSVLP